MAETRTPRDVSWARKIVNRFKARRETETDGGKAGREAGTIRGEYLPKRRVTALDHTVTYKAYRIHTTPHLPGFWISMLVSIGTPKPATKDSLTDTVTRVPGEYQSEAKALEAAKRYIDEEGSRQREQRQGPRMGRSPTEQGGGEGS